MMALIRLEYGKIRQTPVWILLAAAIALFLLSSFNFYRNFYEDYWKAAEMTHDMNPWTFFINKATAHIGFYTGLCILFLITWLHRLETANGTYFRQFLYPVAPWRLFFIKIILVVAAAAGTVLLFFLFTLLILKPAIAAHYDYLFEAKYFEDRAFYPKWFLFYLPAIFRMAVFQEWLTLKFKSAYMYPFIIGFVGIILYFLQYSPYFMTIYYGRISILKETVVSSAYITLFVYFIFNELEYE